MTTSTFLARVVKGSKNVKEYYVRKKDLKDREFTMDQIREVKRAWKQLGLQLHERMINNRICTLYIRLQ